MNHLSGTPSIPSASGRRASCRAVLLPEWEPVRLMITLAATATARTQKQRSGSPRPATEMDAGVRIMKKLKLTGEP